MITINSTVNCQQLTNGDAPMISFCRIVRIINGFAIDNFSRRAGLSTCFITLFFKLLKPLSTKS